MSGRSVFRIAIFAATAAAVTLAVQATPVSAKLCGVHVEHLAESVPIVGQELTIVYYLIDPETGKPTDDADCAVGADAEGEIETNVRAFLGDLDGLSFSAELQRVDAWQYQTTLTFPEPGNWELFFDFSYVRPATSQERSLWYVGPVTRLQRSQYRWKVDVAGSAMGLPAVGTSAGDPADSSAFPLGYLLAAGGVAALAAGTVLTLGRRPQ